MDKYYMFGAGVNGYGVLKFFGDSILGIVDNNPNKEGQDFCGYSVLGMEDFLRRWDGECVIVSAYSKCEDIVKCLNNYGITNVYIAPLMQNGFWEDENQIIDYYQLEHEPICIFDSMNPFSKKIIEALNKRGYRGKIELCRRKDFHSDCGKIYITDTKDDNMREKDIDNIIELTEYVAEKRKGVERIKGTLDGKRCFIIGNGPSLQINDLEKLKENNEITFASNSIWKVFKKTNWRPSYYVIADYKAWLEDVAENPMTIVNDAESFFCPDFYYNPYDYPQNTTNYNLLPFKYKRDFSSDASECVYSGGTVTYVAMQLAIYMGIKEIFLIGVDCTNVGHFYEKANDIVGNESWDKRTYHREYWLEAYRIAKAYSERNNIKIYNATRGGELEVFERVDFDKMFS